VKKNLGKNQYRQQSQCFIVPQSFRTVEMSHTMATPSKTPQRPLWQQLGIWVIALVVSAGLIVSGNQALTNSDSAAPTAAESALDQVEEGLPEEEAPETTDSSVDQAPETSPEDLADEDVAVTDPDADFFTAADQLATLPIKPRASRDGYSRDEFGRAWLDVDRNGCDTRNDMLARDLDDIVVDSRCRVLSGVLRVPFTGDIIFFERGEQTSALVQIDHVVALSNAWQTGAQDISEQRRIEFANDPLNLIAVSGRLNQQKGDSDAASWLPPDRDYWCEYVARQVGVKAHYSLWVTQAEHDQMARVLRSCPTYPALTPADHGQFRPGNIPLP